MPPLGPGLRAWVQLCSCSLLIGRLSNEESLEGFEALEGGASGWKKPGSLTDCVDPCPPPPHRPAPSM